MAKNYDIMLEESNGSLDIMTDNCDVAVGNTTLQNEYIILKQNKGEMKYAPMIGAGIDAITADEDTAYWQREIRENLKKDGMNVRNVEIDLQSKNIKIEAEY